jgi:hypothetical protein
LVWPIAVPSVHWFGLAVPPVHWFGLAVPAAPAVTALASEVVAKRIVALPAVLPVAAPEAALSVAHLLGFHVLSPAQKKMC